MKYVWGRLGLLGILSVVLGIATFSSSGCFDDSYVSLDIDADGDSDSDGDSDTASETQGCVEDDYAPSNTIETAHELILPIEEHQGTLCAPSTCDANDTATFGMDIYKISVPEKSLLTVKLKHTYSTTGDLDLYVVTSDLNILAYVWTETDDEEITDSLMFSGGEVYILVMGWACSNNDYTLSAELSDGTYEGAQDDGDSDCTNDITWAEDESFPNAPWIPAKVLSNWTMDGYVDSDADGVVEEETVSFSLEDIHCDGHNALVVMWGDTS